MVSRRRTEHASEVTELPSSEVVHYATADSEVERVVEETDDVEDGDTFSSSS